MKTLILTFFTIVLSLSFIGCSSKQELTINKKQKTQNNELYNSFYEQYKEWKGVKYKFGGNTKKGIDCSAFVQTAFKNALNVNIPRTTIRQSKIGQKVSLKDIKTGDLVFFKTSRKYRHVGIYLDNGKFLHASTSKGVIISRLDNVYFSKHFWKVQRVLK